MVTLRVIKMGGFEKTLNNGVKTIEGYDIMQHAPFLIYANYIWGKSRARSCMQGLLNLHLCEKFKVWC